LVAHFLISGSVLRLQFATRYPARLMSGLFFEQN